jgi:hypothetical protein
MCILQDIAGILNLVKQKIKYRKIARSESDIPWVDGECLKTVVEGSHPQLQRALGDELSYPYFQASAR